MTHISTRAIQPQDSGSVILTQSDQTTIVISNTRPEYAPALAAMQKISFPTLAPEEYLTEPQYRRYLEIYPQGQFVALDGDRVVGSTTTLRVNFDFEHIDHTFSDITDSGWLGTHNPKGEWLYGADMMVHLDYRRRGIARQLYAARQDLVQREGIRGQLVAGMIPGYHAYADRLSIAEYMNKVVAGTLTDPTLSAQLKIGFRYIAPLLNYLHDPTSGNASALIVWDNPDLI
jgi:GNAT superfamily N-acetyltransferase